MSLLSDVDVSKLAKEVFRQATERWPMPELVVQAAPSFDGDDAIYVTAIFADDARRPDGPHQIELQSELGKLLLAHGDNRLAYLSAYSRSGLDELKHLQSEDLQDDA